MSNALQLDLKHYNLVGMFPDKALYAENADKLMGSRQENFPLQSGLPPGRSSQGWALDTLLAAL